MRHLIAVLVSTTALIATPMAFAGGDAAKGKTTAMEKACLGCHGIDGNSPAPTWPKIAGQGQSYIVKQLRAFRDNDMKKSGRVDPVMAPIAATLDDEQIDNLARRLEADLTTLSLETLDTTGAQAMETGQSLLRQLREAEAVGRLVIDLEQIAARAGSQELVDDVELRDGDRLLVPKRSQEVTVIGETQQNTSHLFHQKPQP